MPSYSTSKTLPSCKVSKKTIEELEDYMRKTLSTHKKDPTSSILTRITIKDSSGREILDSIKDFDRTTFPNDIQAINLQADDTAFPGLSIQLDFHILKRLSELRVSSRGNSAREVVRGIANEIIHRLEPYKTNHYLFHNGFFHFIISLLVVVGVSILLVWDTLSFTVKRFALPLLIASSLVVALYAALAILKPHTMFDTRRNETNEKRTNWVLAGIVGFFLFTVIGVYFRKTLLGF